MVTFFQGCHVKTVEIELSFSSGLRNWELVHGEQHDEAASQEPLREVESVQRETSSQLQHQLTAVVEATRQAGGFASLPRVSAGSHVASSDCLIAGAHWHPSGSCIHAILCVLSSAAQCCLVGFCAIFPDFERLCLAVAALHD